MKKYATFSNPSRRVKALLHAALFYARKDNLSKRKQRLGPELILNGDFSTATGWAVVGLSTINPTNASVISSGDASSIDRSVSGLEIGKFYQVFVTISERVSGALKLDGVLGNNVVVGSANGTYKIKSKAIANSGLLKFSASGASVDLKIDNISFKKVG